MRDKIDILYFIQRCLVVDLFVYIPTEAAAIAVIVFSQ